MKRSSFRQVFVLLLGIFVILGMGLSVVQASTMHIKMMDMAHGMTSSGGGSCDDCGSPGGAKAMTACVAPACAAPMVAHAPSVEAMDIASVAVHYLHLNPALIGRDSGPDPYPPRLTHIG